MTESELRAMTPHSRGRIDDACSVLRVVRGWIYLGTVGSQMYCPFVPEFPELPEKGRQDKRRAP